MKEELTEVESILLEKSLKDFKEGKTVEREIIWKILST